MEILWYFTKPSQKFWFLQETKVVTKQLKENTPQRFFLNRETLIPCIGNNIRWESSKLLFSSSKLYFHWTHTALLALLLELFREVALWTKVHKKYFLFHKLTYLSSSSHALLVTVWTRSPERFCLLILLWERKKKWFALSEAIVILWFILFRPCAFSFPLPENTAVLVFYRCLTILVLLERPQQGDSFLLFRLPNLCFHSKAYS